jgi:hypothetical protein
MAALVVLVGCDDAPAPTASSASTAAKSAPAPSSRASSPAAPTASQGEKAAADEPATIELAGSKWRIGSAHAFTEGGSKITLLVSTHKRFCDNVRGKTIVAQSGERFFGVTIVNQLDSETKKRQRFISDNRFGNKVHTFDKPGAGGFVKILDGTAKKDDTLRVQLRTSAVGATLDGVVTATGCGDLGTADVPAAKPEEGKLVIAGETLALVSALVRPSGNKKVLQLSTAPLGCEQHDVTGEAALRITPGEGEHPAQLALRGDGYETSGVEGEAELAKVTLKLEPNAATGGYTFELEGKLAVGGYPVEVSAKGPAAECP